MITIILAFLSSIYSPTQPPVEHFYIDLNLSQQQLEIGEYTLKGFHKKRLHKWTLQQADTSNLSFLLANEGELLIYIHAMWGGQRTFHKSSLEVLGEIVTTNPKIKKVISILWHTGHFGYKNSWKNALARGEAVANIVEQITLKNRERVHLLAHSMGNRVLEGIAKESDSLRIGTLILAASDVQSDIFDHHFQSFQYQAEQIFVLTHQKDRLLKISKRKLQQERLGRDGVKNWERVRSKFPVEMIDVTATKSDRFLELTNHSYFKTHPEVVAKLKELLLVQKLKQ